MTLKTGTGIVSLAALLVFSTGLFGQCDCGNCGGTGVASTDYMMPDSAGEKWTSSNSGCSACGESSCGDDCYGTAGTRRCGQRCRYLSLFGGWHGVDSFQQQNQAFNAIDVNRGSFDDGTIFGGAIGSQVHPNVRFEIEGTFRENDAETWYRENFTMGVVSASTVAAATGEVESYSTMANFLFDFPRRQPNCWNLYGGFGIGAVFVDGDIATATDSYAIDDGSFAFQAIGGATKAISQRIDFFTEYRFLTAENIFVDNVTTGVPLGDFEYNTNSVVFGLRFRR